MQRDIYKSSGRSYARRRRRWPWVLLILVLISGALGYKFLLPSPVERAVNQLQFDASVTETEQQIITDAVRNQQKTYDGTVSVSAKTTTEQTNPSLILAAYVPVKNVYDPLQNITTDELATAKLVIPADTDEQTKSGLAAALGIDGAKLLPMSRKIEELTNEETALVPVSELTGAVKLLKLNDKYYLEEFSSGALFRSVEFMGEGAANLQDLNLSDLPNKDTVLSVNMTGVTALTRLMLRKLISVKDPLYFSEKIGEFLSATDLTHVSNEVSFKEGCGYHAILFCSDPRFIETLKDSGVDIVEITGNHNNDVGSKYNTETINLYHSLGWKTIGGGLNATEAAKFHVADQDGSKVAFLAYNYPDSPNGGAIAKTSTAGANSFDFDRIKSDIEAAKQQADFVIVDIQFWECYAYPDGYVEYPICDEPIANQRETFQRVADLGANMVIGTSAHQPQTYEIYKGAPIYYGLGNMYFEQVQWPGTERGIILTHYFKGGKLLQTKLSPTVYDNDLQTRLMTDEEAVSLLERLDAAR